MEWMSHNHKRHWTIYRFFQLARRKKYDLLLLVMDRRKEHGYWVPLVYLWRGNSFISLTSQFQWNHIAFSKKFWRISSKYIEIVHPWCGCGFEHITPHQMISLIHQILPSIWPMQRIISSHIQSEFVAFLCEPLVSHLHTMLDNIHFG